MQSYSLMCNFAHIIRINISKTMARQFSKRYLILAAVCVIALVGLTYYYFSHHSQDVASPNTSMWTKTTTTTLWP